MAARRFAEGPLFEHAAQDTDAASPALSEVVVPERLRREQPLVQAASTHHL
jgi:hypothetical protein